MKISAPFVLLLALFSLSVITNADVPPDPGFVRQTAGVTIETKEDVSAYRFFIESAAGIEEISLSKEKPVIVTGANRGGSSRYGNFWAIPMKTLGEEFGVPEKLDRLRVGLSEGKFSGAVKLFSHSFLATIKKEEVSKWQDPVYRIEKDGEISLKATLVSGGNTESKVAASAYSNDPKSPAFWVTVGGGSLMTLAFIFFGVWAIRRSNRPRRMDTKAK